MKRLSPWQGSFKLKHALKKFVFLTWTNYADDPEGHLFLILISKVGFLPCQMSSSIPGMKRPMLILSSPFTANCSRVWEEGNPVASRAGQALFAPLWGKSLLPSTAGSSKALLSVLRYWKSPLYIYMFKLIICPGSTFLSKNELTSHTFSTSKVMSCSLFKWLQSLIFKKESVAKWPSSSTRTLQIACAVKQLALKSSHGGPKGD